MMLSKIFLTMLGGARLVYAGRGGVGVVVCQHIHVETGRRCGYSYFSSRYKRFSKYCQRCGNPNPQANLLWKPARKAMSSVCTNMHEATGKRCGYAYQIEGNGRVPKFCKACGNPNPQADLIWKPAQKQRKGVSSICNNIHEATGKRCGYAYKLNRHGKLPKFCRQCSNPNPIADLTWNPVQKKVSSVCTNIHEASGKRCGYAFKVTSKGKVPKFCKACGNPNPHANLTWKPARKIRKNVSPVCTNVNSATGKRCGYKLISASSRSLPKFCYKCGSPRAGAELNWQTRAQVLRPTIQKARAKAALNRRARKAALYLPAPTSPPSN